MALYNHVDDKDDLVDAMIERAASTIELPEDGLPWRSHAMHRATSAHRVLMRHAWLAPVWTSRISLGPARMAYMDCALRSLRLAGFSGVLLDRTYHAIENHIIGHALQSVGFPLDAEGMKVMGPAFLRAFPVEQYPDLGAHIRHHLESTEPSSAEEEFRFGLDLILDGLERLRTV
jgi:AcrR family transcriptional regulator